MIHGSMNWESINQHQAGFNEVRLQVFDTAHLDLYCLLWTSVAGPVQCILFAINLSTGLLNQPTSGKRTSMIWIL